MNLEKALRIDGWMVELELYCLAQLAAQSSRICEIGSWKGRSTRALVDNTLGVVTAVDTWLGTEQETNETMRGTSPAELLEAFVSNMQDVPPNKLRMYQGTSLDAAKFYKETKETFNLLFIDANHTYEAVKADIEAWCELVDVGGVMCGHDYSFAWPGVVQAVNECFPSHEMISYSIWAVRRIQ